VEKEINFKINLEIMMSKKLILILPIFVLLCHIQNLYAQTSLGARVWTMLPRQPLGENVIKIFNNAKDSVARINNQEPPDPVPEDRPLIITAKQNYVGNDISNEILKIEWYKEVQTKEGKLRQIIKIADNKDGPKPMDILGKDLYDRIAQRNYFWEEGESLSTGVTLINSGRCRDVYWWTPGRYEISAYQIIARVTDKWGGEFRIGDDELGYPFWTAGIFKVGLNHQVLKVFFQGSLGMGSGSGSLIRNRLLEGGMGGGIYFDIDNFGGRVSFSDLTKSTESFLSDSINDGIHYYIPFAVQGYYTFTIPVSYDKLSGALRIKAGAGYHQVLPVRVVNDGNLETVNETINGYEVKRKHQIFPFIRFDYTLKDNTGEAFIQYYKSLLIGGAYNITDWFGIEAKFALWGISGTRDKWEQPSFIMISPRIRF
jgi:hypothetical protein